MVTVAPLAGAWIEIPLDRCDSPSIVVAPLAGAWIEIYLSLILQMLICRRSPRGSVD